MLTDLGETPDKFAALVAAADAALYWQKEHGRNGYAMWRREMVDDMLEIG